MSPLPPRFHAGELVEEAGPVIAKPETLSALSALALSPDLPKGGGWLPWDLPCCHALKSRPCIVDQPHGVGLGTKL